MTAAKQMSACTGWSRRDVLKVAGALALAPSLRAAAKEESARTRVAVIGHTGVGNYGHSLDTMWLMIPETVLIGFADADDKGREIEKAKLPDVPAFADYRQMLKELKPEVVAIAPRDLSEHHDMAIAAAESGAKGIYIEKPFCRTPAEADQIIAACEKSGTRVAIAHRNRFHPAIPVAVEAVRGGEIGELLEIRCRGKEDQRGGCLDLWVLGSHDLDLCLPFSGAPTACSAVIQQGNRLATKEDFSEGAEGVGPLLGNRVHARYETENGIPVFFDSIQGVGVAKAGFGLQLIGTKGIIDFRIDKDPVAHLIPGNPFQPTNTPRPWTPITGGGIGKPETNSQVGKQVAGHVSAARDLLAAIHDNRDSLCNEKTGRTIVEMIHAVFASHVQGGERVVLPLTERQHGLSPWLA